MTIFAAHNNRQKAVRRRAKKRAKKRNKLENSHLHRTHRPPQHTPQARADAPRGTRTRKKTVISIFHYSMKCGFTDFNKSIICRRKQSRRRTEEAKEARGQGRGAARESCGKARETLQRGNKKPSTRCGDDHAEHAERESAERGKSRGWSRKQTRRSAGNEKEEERNDEERKEKAF